jgi:hypothetical protein
VAQKLQSLRELNRLYKASKTLISFVYNFATLPVSLLYNIAQNDTTGYGRAGKDLKGSGRSLIEEISWGIEENQE